MVAAASAVAAATGLRLCGMVEEPPRPSPGGSNASATSVCIISWISRAILPQVPASIADTQGAPPVRARWGGRGAAGARYFVAGRDPLRHAQSVIAEGGQGPRGAAELQRQRLAAQSPQPCAR